jgi:hypothetical protein
MQTQVTTDTVGASAYCAEVSFPEVTREVGFGRH